jgi:ribosome biogenesis GTPase A
MLRKFPEQRLFFASWHRPRDIRTLSEMLVSMLLFFLSFPNPSFLIITNSFIPDIAKEHPHALELNVLVVGMPNVGKSTLLNALRNMGIRGRKCVLLSVFAISNFSISCSFTVGTPKAFQTSANPGMTQALSTRLKISLDPLVYAYDSPGVMLPFLGRGAEGAERGVKLALIGT